MAAQEKQSVGTGVIAAAVAVLVLVFGFLWWHYFGPRPAARPVNPMGTPPPTPGDPRAYPQGMPPGMQPTGPGAPGGRSPG